MPTAMIAVATDSDFTFDPENFERVVRSRWPEAVFVPASGDLATVTLGQWQIPHHDAYADIVLVEVNASGRGLMFDSPDDALQAQAIALSTTVDGFPDDDSVILAEWAEDIITLHPGTTAEELLSQRA